MTPQVEIQLIAAATAVACALVGVFLVLRRMALMSDAISHAILVGIVIAFFVTEDIASPFLILAAAATGVLTVVLVELLHGSGRVREDAAIGLVFPVLFSAGVILISRYAGDVHLDTDAVLLGELAFAPFNRFVAGGIDIGPKALWIMGGVLAVNAAFIALFFKELKLATFDVGLSAALGFSPAAIHYALMSLVSVTAVGAFDAVGSILVVALMIGPPATAYLLTDRLPRMIGLSALFGVIAATAGYQVAHVVDTSIAGSIATMVGAEFLLAFLFSPERGLVALARRRAEQRWSFAETMLAIHLFHHEGLAEAARENRVDHLHEHLRWERDFVARVVRRAVRDGVVSRTNGSLGLTPQGRERATAAIVQ